MATTSTWIGKSNNIKPLWEINFPILLDFYTQHLLTTADLKLILVNKLMGLAPYGLPKYVQK